MEGSQSPTTTALPTDAANALFGSAPTQPATVAQGSIADQPAPVAPAQTPPSETAPAAADPIQAILNGQSQPAAPVVDPEINLLRQKIAEYESRQQPEIHPLAAQVNNLMTGGKSLAEVQKFLHIQSLNVEAMTDIDAVRAEASLKYPTFTPAEIDLVLSNAGIDPDDLQDPKVQLALKMKALDAKQFLSQQKVDTTVAPAAVAQSAASDAQSLIEAQQWGQMVPQIVNLAQIESFAFPVDGAGDYSFAHEYSAEAKSQVQQALAQQRFPLTPEGIQSAKDLSAQMLFALEGKDIVRKAVEDTWKSAQLHFAKQVAGPAPGAPKVMPPAQAGATAKEDLNKLFA